MNYFQRPVRLCFSLMILMAHMLMVGRSHAQTFTGSGGAIPDNAPPVTFVIPVSGLSSNTLNANYGLKRVCVNITHTYDADLVARVIAPDGSTFQLFAGIGGGDDNFTGTCFDSSAATSIISGTAPFTGTFRPMGNIGNVNNGQNGNGNWTISIQDVAAVDIGDLVNWSLEFGNNAPVPFVVAADIPLVVIQGNAITSNYSMADMKIIDHGIGNLNHPTDAGNVYAGKVNIRIRGAFSSTLPQKPFAFTTMNPNMIQDSNVTLLGMPSEHDWILLANYNDKSFVRNPLMHHIFREMGHYSPNTRFVELVWNGEYQGIYTLMEKIKRDSNRVSIPKLTSTDTSGDALTGGYIIKHDYPDAGWTSLYAAQPCSTYYQFNFEYPSSQNIIPQQEQFIHEYFDTLEARLYGTQVYDSVYGYRPYIHANSFVDYMLCNEMSWNLDGFKKSMYFFKEKNSKDSALHAGPLWDFDWALKITPWTPPDLTGWNYATDPCAGDVVFLPWWNIMMQDTFFTNKTKCRWEYHRKYALNLDSIDHYIDAQIAYLQNAEGRHYNYWQTMGINVGTPEVNPATTFPGEIDSLKAFIHKRILWMDTHLPGICKNPIFPAAVSDIDEEAVSCYPNPANDAIYFTSKRAIHTVTIFDFSGRKWKEVKNSAIHEISVFELPAGSYYLQLEMEGGKVIYRKMSKAK